MKPANLPVSVTLALLIHALVLVLLIWQGSVNREFKQPLKTPIIKATLLTEDPALARHKKAKEKLEEKKREEDKQKKQQEDQKRKVEDQKRKVEDQKRLEAERIAAEKQLQVEAGKKEQAEREAAARKKAEEQRQAEQKKQLQLKRLQEEEQKRKSAAEKQRAEEEAIRRGIEERREQEAAQERAEEERVWNESERIRAEKIAEQAAVDAEAVATMESVMFDMISSQWIRPPGVSSELETTLEVRLLGTGELASNGIRVIKSSGNTAFDRSAVQAIEKAAPFPLLRLEPRQRDKFRQLVFVFTPEDLTL